MNWSTLCFVALFCGATGTALANDLDVPVVEHGGDGKSSKLLEQQGLGVES